MIGVVQILNPFEPTKPGSFKGTSANPGSSVRDILTGLGIKEFARPTVVFVDNEPVLREAWETPLEDGQIVRICPVVEGGIFVLIIALVAIAAIAVALTLSVPIPSTPKLAEPDPVYSLRGQTNQLKLGDPIECPYGRVRLWPSYGAKPYNKYINNESFQYQLFCLGHGEFQIEQSEGQDHILIEDTPIHDFEDVEYEIIGPNGDVSLFRDNVQTSSEVGSVELYGPNEAEFDDWFTAVANDAATTTNLLEVDVVLPQGLYRQDKKGRLRKVTVTASFEYMLIDDEGNEIGTWTSLTNFSKSLATQNPKRFTVTQAVPFGRYKVRGKRTNNASNDHKVADTLVWEALRAYLPNVGNYGQVTMLAVKARATANLNDQSERKFNLYATRKLPVYDTETGTWTLQATRNPVWAICDIFRATYGANLAQKYLDLDSLAATAATLETEESWFDWVFDSQSTVWEAAKVPSRAVRGIPLLSPSQVYLQLDRPKTVVQHLFNAENIVEDSFERNVTLWKPEEYDSIEVEYRELDTWKPETVVCALPGSFGDKPKKMILSGVTDRNKAFHEGMYMISSKKYQREELKFTTGVEGLLATYGDLIKVDFDTLGISESIGGLVESIEADNVTINLSRDVVFDGAYSYRLFIRGKDGTPYGPYTVTAGTSANQVVSSSAVSENIVFNSFAEAPLFIFGRSVSFAKDCVITGLRPSDNDTVEVTAVVYDARVYDYDNVDAPELNNPSVLPPNVALPVVTGVGLQQVSGDLYRITWSGSASAQYYIVQTSPDDLALLDAGKVWESIGQTQAEFLEVSLLTETAYIRVAAVNLGQGPWAYYSELLEGDTRVTQGTDSEESFTRVDQDGNIRITQV